jgi:putative transposase
MTTRSEIIAEGSYIHVLNRGVKKMPIYRQKSDLWRLLFNLFYLNSQNVPANWNRVLDKENQLGSFIWPKEWGKREPIVSLLAYVIMPNHFHLILKERQNGGVSKFMHKITMSYSKYVNAKYKESGTLFQGRFKSLSVDEDNYMRYLAVYIMVKNPFELFPQGGLEGAIKNFDKAWDWAIDYPFCSLADYVGKRERSVILDKDILGEVFDDPESFKSFSKDCILGRKLDSLD